MILNWFQRPLLTLIIFSFSVNVHSLLHALIDLDSMAQDFVLETKKIEIPGYPYAFNPAIVRWNEKVLMSFRIRDPLAETTGEIGFVELDENLDIVSSPLILKIQYKELNTDLFTQDPRLLNIGNDLYAVFNNVVKVIDNRKIRRMYVGKVERDEENFFIKSPQVLLQFDCEQEKKDEKNWVPFEYEKNLLLSYSLVPHRIFLYMEGSEACDILALSTRKVKWDWGQLRGGTPALLHNNEYLAFFHSVKDLITVQSNGQRMTHYFMGAYTFNQEPPFALTKISSKPIIAKKFYNGNHYKTWKPLRVVFPVGFIFDEETIWVSYGRQDHEIWIAKLDKAGLFKSLATVQNEEFP